MAPIEGKRMWMGRLWCVCERFIDFHSFKLSKIISSIDSDGWRVDVRVNICQMFPQSNVSQIGCSKFAGG